MSGENKYKLWGQWMVLLIGMLMVSSKYLRVNGDVHEPVVPCYFIFGDSLADNGNNNFLQTLAKVNYSPYGIDFPYGPTGRFCNGRTMFDVIAEYLGFEDYIPSFATANGTGILRGINYASGSAGIRDESGQQLGERIPLDMQLKNHETTISRLLHILGNNDTTTSYLNKCLYTVAMGNNDYINNYFLPQYYPTSHDYTLNQFTQLLIQEYANQLRTLYGYGARKIAVFGLGLIGCTPDAMDNYGNGSACIGIMDTASELFNTMLIPLIDQLNEDLPNATFIYINNFAIGVEAAVLDFKVSNAGCCKVSSDGQCVKDETPCKNRTEFAFWDAFHPSEAVNVFSAARAYNASLPSDAYPFDIFHLVSLNNPNNDDEDSVAAAAM